MPTPPPHSSSRRQFLRSSATALAAGALVRPAVAAGDATPPAKPARNPFAYRFAIGELEAWSISDGHSVFRDGMNLMWPEGDRPEMVANLAKHGERTDTLPLYVNILLIKVGNEIALIDGGFGPSKNPELGWVGSALKSIGVAPEKVTHAFLSHAHSDHIGGFVTDNKAIFPNAALHCLREEVDFWRSPSPDFSKSKRAKGPLPGMVKDARDKFDVLQPNLQIHRDGASLLNGAITIVAAPGHTSGHAGFRIRSGNQTLFHFSDVAHHHTLMFANAGWGIAFDHEPEVAIHTRRKLFTELAAKNERAYGFHLPWPGIGRVLPQGSGFAWEGERWSWGS
ncbi:MAG: hypothetical protein RIQ93_1514 [Verrucomicrobiota bacterium]|jgi:glyoxylase-like metal-dependent hydrolase (beta-lactamase superfamily II)